MKTLELKKQNFTPFEVIPNKPFTVSEIIKELPLTFEEKLELCLFQGLKGINDCGNVAVSIEFDDGSKIVLLKRG